MEFQAQATPLAARLVLPAQPTRCGSRRAQHRLSTEPAQLRMIYHTHTPDTTHRIITDCTSWQKPPPTPAEMPSLTPMASTFAMSLQITVLLFSSHNSEHHFPHQELFCASFQTISEIFIAPATTFPRSCTPAWCLPPPAL